MLFNNSVILAFLRRNLCGLLLGLFVSGGLTAGASAQNLILNGSFESPLVPVNNFTTFGPIPAQGIDNWTIFGPATVAIVDTGFTFLQGTTQFSTPAQDGNQSLDLTGFLPIHTQTGVTQTVATTSGATYLLSYYVGNLDRGSTLGRSSTVDVLVDGVLKTSSTNSTSTTTMAWQQFSLTFTAASSATQISFRNADLGPNRDFINHIDNVVLTVAVTPVEIDIKPGSDPNSINLCSNGAVPIAILGSDTFDVDDIDTETLRFAEAAIKVVGKKDPHTLCSYEDVNDDWIDDLVCHYVTADIAALDGESTSATVNGELLDGTAIEGTDSVNIVKDTCW